MSDEKLNELLTTLPDDGEAALRAARARRRALARLDAPQPSRPSWFLFREWGAAFTVAAAILILAGVLLLRSGAPPANSGIAVTRPPAASKPDTLRVKWVLADGTRVLWTFREDF